jgi:hypothetical protein
MAEPSASAAQQSANFVVDDGFAIYRRFVAKLFSRCGTIFTRTRHEAWRWPYLRKSDF